MSFVLIVFIGTRICRVLGTFSAWREGFLSKYWFGKQACLPDQFRRPCMLGFYVYTDMSFVLDILRVHGYVMHAGCFIGTWICHLCWVFYRYTDMEAEDYSFYQGLVFLLENNVNDLGYELTFNTEVQH